MNRHDDELCFLTIKEAATMLKTKTVSPVELTEAFFRRIERYDNNLHSYVTLLKDSAIKSAVISEKEIMGGDYKGPLHGIPIAVKDLYSTKGIRTTAHSRILEHNIPKFDSTVVQNLKNAGAIILGKLAMSEFALGRGDEKELFPSAKNPWNLDHVPGSSSSGSGAATTAELCMGSLGSDTGGSIRGPASFCNITGIKPSFGRVSNYGVVPLAWTLDTCGPMTRTAEDAALMLQVIAGQDSKDPSTLDMPVPNYAETLQTELNGLKIGVPRDFFFNMDKTRDLDKEIVETVDKALETLIDLGAQIKEVNIPSLEYTSANTVIMLSEAYSFHENNLRTKPEDYGPVRRQFLLGGLLSASDYIQAQRVRNVISQELSDLMKDVDVLVTPSFPFTAPRFDDRNQARYGAGFRFLAPFNLSGLPAMSVPCGFHSNGLPIGMQVVGNSFREDVVLSVGHAYQNATSWHKQKPVLDF